MTRYNLKNIIIGFVIGFTTFILFHAVSELFSGNSFRQSLFMEIDWQSAMVFGAILAVLGYFFRIEYSQKAASCKECLKEQTLHNKLISNTTDVLSILNINGDITYTSSNVETYFGWVPTDIKGMPGWDIAGQNDKQKVKDVFIRALESESEMQMVEFQYRCKDGTFKAVNLKVRNYINDKHINGVLLTYHDVSARTNTIEALEQEEFKFNLLFDNMPDAVCILNDKGEILNMNEAGAELMESSIENLIGFFIPDSVHPEDKELSAQYFERLKKDGLYKDYEGRLITCKGNVKWVQVSSIAIWKKGVIVGSQDIIRDISTRKDLEFCLKSSANSMEELIATKDKFFSIIAHDLKGPLLSLLKLTEMLTNNILKYDQTQLESFIKLIHENHDNIYKLLVNLLDWATNETGKMQFKPIEFEASQFFKDKIKLFSDLAGSKNINISLKMNQDFKLYADENMLSTIIRNLVSNAIKFTRKNGVIDVIVHDNSKLTNISVKDTGIGIEKETIDKLFDLGQIKSTKGTDKETGTGLGLLLCKEFVTRHGGKMWVKSEKGRGSEFGFSIPKLIQE